MRPGEMAYCLPTWDFLTRDNPDRDMILRIATEGVDMVDDFEYAQGRYRGVDFAASLPPPLQIANNPNCDDFESFLLKKFIERCKNGSLLCLGKVGEVPPPRVVNALTMEETKPRVCGNLIYVNKFTRHIPMRMETAHTLHRWLGRFGFTWDVRDGYSHVWVTKRSREYLGYRLGGYYFVSTVLEFGWQNSCYYFTLMALAPVIYARTKLGIPAQIYVDDGVGSVLPIKDSNGTMVDETPEQELIRCKDAAFILLTLYIEAGFFLHLLKGCWMPAPSFGYLGLDVRATMRRHHVPPEKVTKFLHLLDFILSGTRVRVLTMQRFLGKCVSYQLAVVGAMLFTRTGYAAVADAVENNYEWILITPHDLRPELERWYDIRDAWNGAPFRSAHHAQLLSAVRVYGHGDASDRRWALLLWIRGKKYTFSGTFAPEQFYTWEIFEKEAFAFHVAIAQACERGMLDAVWLDVRTDSMVFLDSFLAQKSSSPVVLTILKNLHDLQLRHAFHLTMEHVRTYDNLADAPTREPPMHDAALETQYFLWLSQRYCRAKFSGRFGFDVDLMADDTNKKVSCFFSRNLCPGTAGVNLFAQGIAYHGDGTRLNCYVYPPFNMVGAVLHFCIQENAVFTIVVPESTAEWWPVAWARCSDAVVLAEIGEEAIAVHQGRGHSMLFPLRQRLWAFHFN
jgi:hypothetical protein